MAAIGIEVGTVSDRSFNAGGLANKFKTWVVKNASNHGPAWFIFDDQSALGTDPYIVVCNQSSPTVNSKAMFFKLLVVSASEQVRCSAFLAWDATNHVGLVEFDRQNITTQTGTFAYYFRGGPTLISVIARIGTALSFSNLTTWTGIWNGTSGKGTEPESASSTLAAKAYLATDPGGYLNNYHLMTGFAANLDGAGKLYFSIISDGGSNFHIAIFKDSSRTLLVGHTASFAASSTGNKAITADNTSGLGGTIGTAITVAAATNIDCRFNRLTVQTGEGVNFTALRRYFLIDFTGYVQRIRYVQIMSISGDVLTIDSIGSLDFGVGAYLSPYPHRWTLFGAAVTTGSISSNSQLGGQVSKVPYISSQGSEYVTPDGFFNGPQVLRDFMQNSLSRANPDDDQQFAAQNAWVVESSNQASSNRIWGKEDNIVVAAGNGVSAMQDRRTLSTVPYIALQYGNNAVSCIIDQESLS